MIIREKMMTSWNVHFKVHVFAEDREIVDLVAQCHALAPVINNIPITPRREKKIDHLNILRAIRGTTGIEGARLTEEEVRLIMDSPRSKRVLPKGREREEQEARNADLLRKWVARKLRKTPDCVLTERVLCDMHKITTHNINYEGNIPGEYRSRPVQVGDYLPPRDGDEVRRLVKEFISWLYEGPPRAWDPIIRAIVAHFYVVSIHPFVDGNGRTSRAVESFLLYQAGINARGFYSLANFYYQHRSEYVSFLDEVRFRTNGDLTPFVLFALEGLASELQTVHEEVMLEVREIAFRDYVRDQLQNKLTTKSGRRMFEFMFNLDTSPASIKEIRLGGHPLNGIYKNLTPRTLYRDLAELEELQLITVEKDGSIKANLSIMSKFTAREELIS
ncbi:MAG: hypothetical protein A2Z28_02065 [Chloroflexi bacterium RBG_16_51_9]|nr:MAG: hypothetical protein A2Z28_02065 [Chloroflexi bacterium RBG_16_51_9]